MGRTKHNRRWRNQERWWNTGTGYVSRFLPSHPLATALGGNISRHRHVMWTSLGEPPPDEATTPCEKCGRMMAWHGDVLNVHHIDQVPGHDELSNLQVLCVDCHSAEHGWSER